MSFSSEIKDLVSTLPVKRPCCRKALLLGLLAPHSLSARGLLAFSTDNENVAAASVRLFKQCFSFVPEFEGNGHSLSGPGENGRAEKTNGLSLPGVGHRQIASKGIHAKQGANADHENNSLIGSVDAGAGQTPRQENAAFFCKMKVLPKAEGETLVKSLPATDESLHALLICDNCLNHFLRGLFLAGGTVSNPTKKGYHLELLFKDDEIEQTVFRLLSEHDFSPKPVARRKSHSLYFKNSEKIEDFLTVIGAPHAALDLMNAKIMRDIRNNENRRSNCDTSNIYRATGAADLQIRAIRKLIECGKLSLLPGELQITAKIRLENPECSLLEIAALHEPPLTKSGVNHRMKKIIDFSETITANREA